MRNTLRLFGLFFFLCCFHETIKAQNKQLETYFDSQTDISFNFLKNSSSENNDYYELRIKQPIDHDDLTKGYFEQRVYLNHKGFSNKTVIATEGYSATPDSHYELTEMLEANQIDVEYRYFGKSVPETINFEYLNLKQSSADLHHIHELLSPLYKNNWMSTGISKGGTTCLFYKFFYPDDVSATVAYVAPIANTIEDTRIYDFLDSVGNKSCRKKIKKFQIQLLKNSAKAIELLKDHYDKATAYQFNYLGFEKAFEYSILEFPFAFWQWGADCSAIPSPVSSIESLVSYYISHNPISLFSDQLITYYEPHYYQAATEMGYYGYETKPFKKHLKTISKDKNLSAIFTPNHKNLTYNKKQYDDFLIWLEKKGNNIIYIYGDIDPWSACAISPSKEVNSLCFMLTNKHHGDARIKNMSTQDKKTIFSSLNKWLHYSK